MNAEVVAHGMGWVGAVALLAAYGMLCFCRLSAESAIYYALNIFGSLLLVINAGFHGARVADARQSGGIGLMRPAIQRCTGGFGQVCDATHGADTKS
jgi:hypothetical protein